MVKGIVPSKIKKCNVSHRWHYIFGRKYFERMYYLFISTFYLFSAHLAFPFWENAHMDHKNKKNYVFVCDREKAGGGAKIDN